MAYHLVVDPDAVDALVMQWIQTCEAPGGDAPPTLTYARLVRSVIRALSRGTCDVSLFAIPIQRHDHLEYEAIFGFLPDVSGGDGEDDDRHLLSLPITTMQLDPSLRAAPDILGACLTPRTPWPRAGYGVRPFSLVSDQGLNAELMISGFAGNRRLAAYLDANYIVTLLLFRLVELFPCVLGPITFGESDDHALPTTTTYLCQALGKALMQESEAEHDDTANAWKELGQMVMTDAARPLVLLEKLRERRAQLSGQKRAWMEEDTRRMTDAFS